MVAVLFVVTLGNKILVIEMVLQGKVLDIVAQHLCVVKLETETT